MTLQADINRDVAEVFMSLDDFAEPAIVYPAGHPSFPLSVIFDSEYLSQDPNTGAAVMNSQPMIEFEEAAYTVQRNTKDEIEVRGVRYKVGEFKPNGTGTVTAMLKSLQKRAAG